MSQLITKTDIASKRQISKSVADAKIDPFIEDAELLDLLPLLGEKFYFAVKENPTDYVDLLEEKLYQYDKQTIKSPGIKRVLIDFAFARYMMHGSVTDTPFGMVQKESQDSTAVSRTDKKESYKLHQQTAMQYWAQVENYLVRNSNLYPLFRQYDCVQSQRRTFKLNHITR
jgi:hypothetical protein